MNKRLSTLTLIGAALCLTPLLSQTALAAGVSKSPVTTTDVGDASATDDQQIAVSLALQNRPALEAFVASTVDPASPNFRKFITPREFALKYGQPRAVIDRVTTTLASQGITVTKVYGNNLVLMAHGTNAALSAAFGTRIHRFVTSEGASFQRPVDQVKIPAVLQDVVTSVAGLSTQPIYRPHLRQLTSDLVSGDLAAAAPDAVTPTAGTPGTYSVADLAKQYNITPLYSAGITGAGTTLGIMTFATFNVADVGVYWGWAGLADSSTSRVTTVNVGTGQTSSGADETTLDVEQSGGVAPGAKIRVYIAANTDAGAIALYTQAVTENLCDTLSISWGEGEAYYQPADLLPYDAVFLQAASQGTPISASSGDEASYDMNYSGAYPYPNYSTVLSLDYPSSSPYVFSAGGTTLPVTLKLGSGSNATTIVVPAERPWAWDYLKSYVAGPTGSGLTSYYSRDFPVGGGGGVSIQYPLPTYQQGLPGVLTSAPGQSMYCLTPPTATQINAGVPACTRGQDVLDLQSGYAGRNSPDVSLNADPETGYELYYNGKYSKGSGGTSFVAPQLNGIFALMTQKLGGRVGQPHPQFYSLFKTLGYGSTSPFRAITTGTNLFYQATNSYNPASGLGSLDVANLAAGLQSLRPAAAPAVAATARK